MSTTTYTITFNQILCQLPSSGINIDAAKAAENVLDLSGSLTEDIGKISGIFGPEGEAVGAALEVVGGLEKIGAAIADLIIRLDAKLRNNSKEPDQFFISVWPSATTQPLGDDSGKTVKYPEANTPPKQHGATVDLAKGDSAPGLPLSFDITVDSTTGAQVCLWDWDAGVRATTDDLLWSFVVNDAAIGAHQGSYYNGLQDCMYYLDYEIS